ncbi:MAG: hypothetical protein M3297_04920 [Thermoproteota archaeon]|nr:hypothetical protein [Thermoproteota archaeon]
MDFPSWRNLKKGINEFEQRTVKSINEFEKQIYEDKSKLTDKIQQLKDDHPLFDEFIQKSIPFLPTPFNGIAQAIYDSFEGSKKDKFEEVLKFLYKVKSQSEQQYEKIPLSLAAY